MMFRNNPVTTKTQTFHELETDGTPSLCTAKKLFTSLWTERVLTTKKPRFKIDTSKFDTSKFDWNL